MSYIDTTKINVNLSGAAHTPKTSSSNYSEDFSSKSYPTTTDILDIPHDYMVPINSVSKVNS